jgi:hypothetical protein
MAGVRAVPLLSDELKTAVSLACVIGLPFIAIPGIKLNPAADSQHLGWPKRSVGQVRC